MLRKSLAPVNSSAANVRASIAPREGRQSLAPGKMNRMSIAGGGRASSIGARQSLAPGRRSTLAGPGAADKMEDPRSTKDKAWTKAANERIVEYLVSHNYDRQISPKSLSAPTKKDYLHTLAFLYNKIDPLFEFADEKVEKAEVAIIAMFKRLKYPISISKAHLQAIGAPQSMPSLTASMLWLVELLEYEGRVDVARQEEFSPGDENPDKMFFDLLARSYEDFLTCTAEVDNSGQVFEDSLQTAFATKNESTQEEVTRMSLAIEAMEKEIELLQGSKLEILQEQRVLLLKDLDKFNLLIGNLNTHLDQVKTKTEELAADHTAKEEELVELQREQAELKEVVAQQDTRAIDAHRIAADRTRLAEDLRRTGREKDSLQNEIYQAEIGLAKQQTELERQIQEYHRAATELKLIPSSAKHADGISYEIPVASRGNGVEQLVALGGKKDLRDDLVTKTDTLQARQQEQVSNRIVEEEKLKEITVAAREKREEVGTLEGECVAREAALVKEKEALDLELREASQELQSIENLVANGSTHFKARVTAAKKRLDEAVRALSDLQAVTDDNRVERTAVTMRLCHMAAQHKFAVKDRLENLEVRLVAIQKDTAEA
ncbi:HEC/Ndc80p family-domain-containing protein [Baffinella frigidus]|nr:HEC/Ndc80p family-domain-containing protein [Cryptophyta sp. CCMP2293]